MLWAYYHLCFMLFLCLLFLWFIEVFCNLLLNIMIFDVISLSLSLSYQKNINHIYLWKIIGKSFSENFTHEQTARALKHIIYVVIYVVFDCCWTYKKGGGEVRLLFLCYVVGGGGGIQSKQSKQTERYERKK